MIEEPTNQSFPDRSAGGEEAARQFAVEAAQMLSDDKCEEIALLDVRELSQVTDFILIGTGTSQRQMASALDHVEDLGTERGFIRHGQSRDERSLWLLADFVDVVVHLFEPNARAHYDLEMLWGDAPRLTWDGPRSTNGSSRSNASSESNA